MYMSPTHRPEIRFVRVVLEEHMVIAFMVDGAVEIIDPIGLCQ